MGISGQLVLPCCSDAPAECEVEIVQRPGRVIEWYPLPRTERTYRILHQPTHTWAELNADSAEEAVRIAGRNHPDTWPDWSIDWHDDEVRRAASNNPYVPGEGGSEWRMEDCYVRQYTGRGWGKVRGAEEVRG